LSRFFEIEEAGSTATLDGLGALAWGVARRVRAGRGDRASFGDCFQQAFTYGLEQLRRRQAAGKATSKKMLRKAMNGRVHRMLAKMKGREIRDGDCGLPPGGE
jgi:hypothetical protein